MCDAVSITSPHPPKLTGQVGVLGYLTCVGVGAANHMGFPFIMISLDNMTAILKVCQTMPPLQAGYEPTPAGNPSH